MSSPPLHFADPGEKMIWDTLVDMKVWANTAKSGGEGQPTTHYLTSEG
jgi:hypothetical protein